MLKIYKMRIRYSRDARLTQAENNALWRGALAGTALPYIVNEEDAQKRVRITFGPALGLGQSSECEYADLYFSKMTGEEEILKNLASLAEQGIALTGVKHIPCQFPSIAALSDAAEYEVSGWEKYAPAPLNTFLNSEKIIVTLGGEDGPTREIDVKPFIYKANIAGGVLNIVLCREGGRSVKVETVLAKWLNPGAEFYGKSFEDTDIKIIKKNVYCKGSLGGLIAV